MNKTLIWVLIAAAITLFLTISAATSLVKAIHLRPVETLRETGPPATSDCSRNIHSTFNKYVEYINFK